MLCFHFLPLLGCSSFTPNPTPTQFPSPITISPTVKKKIHAKITNSFFDVNILFLLVKFWKTRSQKNLKTLLLILMSLLAKGMEFFECYFPPFHYIPQLNHVPLLSFKMELLQNLYKPKGELA